MGDGSPHNDEKGDVGCRYCKWEVVTVCISDIWRGLAERSGVHHARPAMKSPGYKTAPDDELLQIRVVIGPYNAGGPVSPG